MKIVDGDYVLQNRTDHLLRVLKIDRDQLRLGARHLERKFQRPRSPNNGKIMELSERMLTLYERS